MIQFIHGLTFKNTFKFLSLFLFLSFSVAVQAAEDLLPPEKAFALKAWIENDRVIAQVDIADKYYLYRDSVSFTSDTDGVEFGIPSASDGKIKNDEFFGEVEVYRNSARVTLPLVYNALVYNGLLKPPEIIIKTSMQGCADVGVCYPPLHQILTMNTGSNAVALPVSYQYKPEAKPQNIATASLQSMDNILAQLTNTLNTDRVSNAIDSAKATLAPLIEPIVTDPIVEPIKNLLANDDKPEPKDKPIDPLSLLQSLGDDLGLAQQDEIPSPDKAFQLSATLDDNHIVQTSIEIYPTTYLYKDKIKIKLVDGHGHETGAVSLPKGDEKHDEFFGDIVVFHEQLKTSIPIITEVNASSQLVLSYGYQGCVEDKICYPPITKFLLLDLNSKEITISDEQPTINQAQSNSASSVETIKTAHPDDQQNYQQPPDKIKPASINAASINDASISVASISDAGEQTEQGRFASIIEDGSILLIIASFFLAGLLLTFTPCVFPMIPILSGIIAGQGDKITTKKAFLLSSVYVLAMASTYAVAGFIVGKFGAEYNISSWMQDPIVLSVFAAIFVLLALSMFGFYDLQMPAFIQSRLSEFSNKQEGGNLIGVAIMGLLSALIVGPCITAPLVGALLFISQSGDPELGALALFALGMGMGLPLLIIGTSAGKFLPKAGAWMDAVKAVFGVGLLAVAIWMLERFLASEIIMSLIALLLIVSGMYILSAQVKENISGWGRIARGMGFILTLYGSFYLVGMAAGGQDLIQPLKGIIKLSSIGSAYKAESGHLVFQQIKGQQGLKDALAQHKGKIVMLDFYADWCISCKEMEKYAFTHPKVLAALKDVATLQTDVTPNDSIDRKFMASLNIYGPPAILFYDKNGIEVAKTRVVGEMSGEEFAAHIIKVIAKIDQDRPR